MRDIIASHDSCRLGPGPGPGPAAAGPAAADDLTAPAPPLAGGPGAAGPAARVNLNRRFKFKLDTGA
jgi:hypothetical protein